MLSDTAEFCYKCDDFYHANDEGGLARNDPEIGIQWPKVDGAYQGTASAEGYSLDGVALNLSDNDQKWLVLEDTFKFRLVSHSFHPTLYVLFLITFTKLLPERLGLSRKFKRVVRISV